MYFPMEQEPQNATTLFVRSSGRSARSRRAAARRPPIHRAVDRASRDPDVRQRGARIGPGHASGAVAARPVRGDGAGAGGGGHLRCHVVHPSSSACARSGRAWRWARHRAASCGWCSGRAPASPRSAPSSGSMPPGLPVGRCAGFLYGTSPADPAILIGAAEPAARHRALACYQPARRATRVDPVEDVVVHVEPQTTRATDIKPQERQTDAQTSKPQTPQTTQTSKPQKPETNRRHRHRQHRSTDRVEVDCSLTDGARLRDDVAAGGGRRGVADDVAFPTRRRASGRRPANGRGKRSSGTSSTPPSTIRRGSCVRSCRTTWSSTDTIRTRGCACSATRIDRGPSWYRSGARTNHQVASVMRETPAADLDRARARHNLQQIGFQPLPPDEPATLAFLMRDYVVHLQHHLRQILR